MRRLLEIVQAILKAFGGYLLLVGVLCGVVFTIESIYSKVLGERLGSALFKIFGSWLLVAAAHKVGKMYGNHVMRSRVIAGNMSGHMRSIERFWLEAKAVLYALVFVVVIAGGQFDFHFRVAAIVIPVPVLIGVEGEIRRWLQGIERLTPNKPDQSPAWYFVKELDPDHES